MWTTVISHPPSGGSARVARAVGPKLAEPPGEVNAGLQAQGHGLLWRGSCHRPPTAPVNRPLLIPRHVSLGMRRTDSLRRSGPEPSDWFSSMFRRSFLRIMPDPPRLSPPRAARVPRKTCSLRIMLDPPRLSPPWAGRVPRKTCSPRIMPDPPPLSPPWAGREPPTTCILRIMPGASKRVPTFPARTGSSQLLFRTHW